jgi:hypothetical protein
MSTFGSKADMHLPKLSPKVLEPGRGQFGVPHGVLIFLCPEMSLQSSRVACWPGRNRKHASAYAGEP